MAVAFPHQISTSLQQKHPCSSILMHFHVDIWWEKLLFIIPRFIKSFIPHHPSQSFWVAGRTSAKDPFCDKWPQAGGSGSAWQIHYEMGGIFWTKKHHGVFKQLQEIWRVPAMGASQNGWLITHRIHGAGIYANIKGVYWWDPCYHI